MNLIFRPGLLLTLLLGTSAAGLAQRMPAALRYADYTWEARRKQLPISDADAKLPAVVLKDMSVQEYLFDPNQKEMRLFSTDHRIVRVNSADGIERYNRIYVPVPGDTRIISVKARTISPKGEVVEVTESNMKELKDNDGGRGFKIFAVEGVEKGSEIEYLYTRDRDPSYFGREYLQTDVPARNVLFELITPENLTFDTRVYHGPAASRDTVVAGKRIIRAALAQVPAAREEGFSNEKAERMRIEYKLAYSAARGRTRLFTWSDASQYLYGAIYDLSKDETKALDKLVKQIKLPAAGDVATQVPAVEDYVKSNFNLDENGSPDLAKVISSHNASELGFTRLTAALLRKLNIDHELVVTSDRSEVPFDKDFDSWDYLENYAFYFPATKQLMAPSRPDYRYGMVPPGWTANQGLFIKRVQLGSTSSAVGTVREIPTLNAAQSPHDLDIKVRFSPALDKTLVDVRQVLGGYQAQVIQPYYSFIPEDKRTEAMQSLVKSSVPDATFKSLTVTNGERGLSPLAKPFIIDASVESSALLDKAGPKYLFKVGTLLGPQSELYQTEERQNDVENDFNRRYNRSISIELPAGYSVRNLQDLNYDVKAGGEAAAPLFLFRSSYEQKGQTLTINIQEHYDQIRWPKKDFEVFRNVVNAAANFNKVVLVLEKKG
ncbi:DUF3857 domain-containing protein [Hymenobacter sp. BT175]|uniref:DUF3857 domain-containing protein n=1 Tax=Hymenobacter translucens TaxID=2886507 RepID=UPI001D0ECF1B|nr:DUF3857 domain-containing protein [Hymenobacter translucens]MCC2548386.1 DUF3857 domain-containing protein [Hymenobacter translucens]